MQSLTRALAIVGTVAGACALAKLARCLLLRAQLALGPAHLKRFRGDWALVTGGSEGVGLALAEQLAAQGINLLLVSRSPAKLAAAAARISSQHPGVAVETLPTDLTQPEAVEQLLAPVQGPKGHPISLLISNAGGSVSSSKPYQDFTAQEAAHIQALNGSSAYALIQGLLPGMVERGRGAIVAISSQAVLMPCFLAPYAAEKVKLESLISALDLELQDSGVSAQAFRLGAVLTPGLRAARASSSDPAAAQQLQPSLMAPRPEAVARQAAAALGASGTGPVFTPYLPHALSEALLGSIWPPGLQRRLLRGLALSIKRSWDDSIAARSAGAAAAAGGRAAGGAAAGAAAGSGAGAAGTT